MTKRQAFWKSASMSTNGKASYVKWIGPLTWKAFRGLPGVADDVAAVFFDEFLIWSRHNDAQNYFGYKPANLLEVRSAISMEIQVRREEAEQSKHARRQGLSQGD